LQNKSRFAILISQLTDISGVNCKTTTAKQALFGSRVVHSRGKIANCKIRLHDAAHRIYPLAIFGATRTQRLIHFNFL
jgi:hypothetical protein